MRTTVPSGTETTRSLPRGAVTLAPAAVLATVGAPVRVVAEREEGRGVAVGGEVHVAARTAVAAVGTALRDVRLASERDHPGTAVTTAQVDLHLIDER